MDTLTVSKFKATCLAVVEEVAKTKQGVIITKRAPGNAARSRSGSPDYDGGGMSFMPRGDGRSRACLVKPLEDYQVRGRPFLEIYSP